MKYSNLTKGILIKRYKRFLADIQLENGEVITAHCPNSGSMKTCAKPGWRVLISKSDNPKRKLKYTWELVHNEKCWISINTNNVNNIIKEALENNEIEELSKYNNFQFEKKINDSTRLDLFLENESEKCYVEIKSVSLVEDDSKAFQFPDSVTKRGQKHLEELIKLKKEGNRAIILFLIKRNDADYFSPAKHIDCDYANLLKEAHATGVEILPLTTFITESEIKVDKKISYKFE